MKILDPIKKIPGGLMLIPMLVTALINTVAPGALKIGSPTTSLFTSVGTMTFIGMLLFVSGSQLQIKQLGNTFKRGTLFVFLKVSLGYITSLIIIKTFGLDGIFGISAMALTIVMAACNPGVYMALVSQYGDNVDRAAMGVINIIAVPATSLFILNMNAGTGFDIMIIVTSLTPFLIGMILANIDPDIQKLFSTGTPMVLILLGFCFGSTINFVTAFKAGLTGILLGAMYLAICFPIMISADKLILRRPGYAGAAFVSIGGVSISTPPIVAALLPQFQPYVDVAVGQLTMAFILSAIFVPMVTRLVVKKWGSAADYDKNHSNVGQQI